MPTVVRRRLSNQFFEFSQTSKILVTQYKDRFLELRRYAPMGVDSKGEELSQQFLGNYCLIQQSCGCSELANCQRVSRGHQGSSFTYRIVRRGVGSRGRVASSRQGIRFNLVRDKVRGFNHIAEIWLRIRQSGFVVYLVVRALDQVGLFTCSAERVDIDIWENVKLPYPVVSVANTSDIKLQYVLLGTKIVARQINKQRIQNLVVQMQNRMRILLPTTTREFDRVSEAAVVLVWAVASQGSVKKFQQELV